MLHWFFGNPLATGTAAPDFRLPDDQGIEVTLRSQRGKNVVLVFYPADDTSVCTRQLCEFRDHWGEAESKNTVVFGINPGNVASHAGFRRRQGFPFRLLSDRKQRVAKLYRAGGVIVRRTVYLIGPDGNIRFGKRGKPAPEEVLEHADCEVPSA